jgi:hypothetical protein
MWPGNRAAPREKWSGGARSGVAGQLAADAPGTRVPLVSHYADRRDRGGCGSRRTRRAAWRLRRRGRRPRVLLTTLTGDPVITAAGVEAGPSRWEISDFRERTALGAGVLALAVLLAGWPPFSSAWIALGAMSVALLATVHGAGSRLLIGAHVGFVVLSFVLAPLLGGHGFSSLGPMWTLAAVWFFAWAAGQYFAAPATRKGEPEKRASTRVRQSVSASAVMFVGAMALLIQAYLIRQAQIGYAAQVRGYSSIGLASIAASVGPVALAVSYWLVRVSPRPSAGLRRASTALVVAQSVAIAATGFRGGGPLYLLTLWLLGKNWSVEQRAKARRSLLFPLVAVGIPVLFFLGAQERARVATTVGRTSEGTELKSITALPTQIIERFDLQPAVQAALDRADFPSARRAAAPSSQLVAFVPRFFWPDKPTIDYGKQIAYEFFDIPLQYTTASSITWLGDLYVQGGTFAVAGAGLALGFLLTRVLANASVPTSVNLVIGFTLIQAFLNLESPVIIVAAAGLRTVIVLALLYQVVLIAQRTVSVPVGRRLANLDPAPG